MVPSGAAGDAAFFESKVRPVLVEHCYKCHSEEAGKSKGGLVLDTRAGLRKGGDNGAIVVAGDPEASRLVEAVRWSNTDTKMPPKKQLSAQQIADLEAWVKMGAPDPRDDSHKVTRIEQLIAQGKSHWAFQPLATPPPGATIDSLVRAGLEGLEPSPEADPATLRRRVSFDLIGLPPDESHESHESQVDRLLASPQYGERWGRHWLDLARYADTCGVHNDLDRPHAWKYRDYVIRSFNEDKPYARFVAEQLAGDEVSGASEETLIATGFCRNGPSNDDNMGKTAAALAQYRADQMDDVISTTASVFIGITLGCARCHDHKTDPFTQRDYYSLFAVFNGTEKLGMAKGAKNKDDKNLKEAVNVQALIEKSAQVPPTHVLLRGLAANRGDQVPAATPAVLNFATLRIPEPAPEATTSGRRLALAEWITLPENPLTWRVLANRIWQHHFGAPLVATPSDFGLQGARPANAALLDYLAARLIASGGRLKPLHREILLSRTYRQSSAHREDAHRIDPENTRLWRMNKQRLSAETLRDSILAVSGKLNARMGGPGIKPRIRPELLPTSQRNKWPELKSEGPEQWRRSVYIYVKRQLLLPMLELFDAPTTTDSCPQRTQSVVPTQALVLMNDEFVEEHAAHLAARAGSVEKLCALVWSRPPTERRLREATAFVEKRELHYAQTSEGGDAHHRAMTDLAHVLLNSSEFLYVE